MFKWKRLLTTLVAVTMVGALAACGGGTNGNAAKPAGAAGEGNAATSTGSEPVKLRIMWWGGAGTA